MFIVTNLHFNFEDWRAQKDCFETFSFDELTAHIWKAAEQQGKEKVEDDKIPN